MSGSAHPTAGPDFGAGYWEERHRRGAPTSTDGPSPLLLAQTAALAPGRALDAGCGRGANAVALASRGWHVTAVDVSPTALTLAQQTARAAGRDVADRIAWVHADLRTRHPGNQRFDLVASLYVHVPGPASELFGRLAGWVAPEGTLLVVGHGHDHGHPAASRISAAQVTACLAEDQWEVVVAESRASVVQRPDGAGTVARQDTVVRARRTAPSRP